MYVARDEDGQLWLFTYKPRQAAASWHYDEGDDGYGDIMELNPELYPNVTFSSGPLEVVLKPVVEESNILKTLGNNQVQDILEEMGMLDEDGNCPYTAEEIFKAGIGYAFKQSID